MARGWESKSVEAQIEESSTEPSHQENYSLSPQQREQHSRKESLSLSRSRILQQLEESNSERYSELLRRTLAGLDAQLADRE